MKPVFSIFVFLFSVLAGSHSAGAFFIVPDDGLKEAFPFAVLGNDTIQVGVVEQGKSITGQIRVSNEGSYDLLIVKARSSCGLMIQTWPSSPIKPGENVSISFRYDSSRLGPFERFITIHTNAWQKNLVVVVTGEVVRNY